jgi:hypothetical protein
LARILTIIVALLSAIGVSAINGFRLDWPLGFWTQHQNWLIAAFVITAFAPIAQVFFVEIGERLRRKAVERERKIERFLSAALIQAVNHGADWQNTGIQVFLLRGWKWRKRHVRAAKVRIGAIPSSGVKWTKGKGIIGKCWETRMAASADLGSHFAPFLHSSKPRWEALSSDTRYGLSFEDFQRLGAKYGWVAAVPIIDGNDKYLGCVSVDTPPQAQLVNETEVLKSLTLTASVVQVVL